MSFSDPEDTYVATGNPRGTFTVDEPDEAENSACGPVPDEPPAFTLDVSSAAFDMPNLGLVQAMPPQHHKIYTPIVLLPNAQMPEYKTDLASGMDCYAYLPEQLKQPKPEEKSAVAGKLRINPGAHRLVSLGFKIAVPPGYELQIRPRSGMALKNYLTIRNTPGTIDADYRGEVKAMLANDGFLPYYLEHGERICQAVLAPVMQAALDPVDELPDTARGDGGFGHTGTK
jgi:dUTP pyrophosphatase